MERATKFLAAALVIGSGATASVDAAPVLPVVGSGTLVIRLDAETGVTTTGNLVNTWADQVLDTTNGGGYGGSPTQPNFSSVGGSEPVLVPNALNGHSVIRFTNDYLRADNTTTIGGDDSNKQTFFFVTSGTTNPQGLFDTAPLVAGPLRFLKSSPNGVASQENDNGGIPITLNPMGPSNGTVLSFTHDGDIPSNSRVWNGYVNGNDYPGSTNTEPGRRILYRNPTLGAINLGSPFYGGDIAEVLVYQGILSRQDREAVQLYLVEKYIPEPTSMLMLAPLAGLLIRRRKA